MTMEHSIRLLSDGKEESATVVLSGKGRECHLVFRYRDKHIEASASDYFKAFGIVRQHLEEEGLQPLCYGASINVWPSGMGRDMGQGLTAYRITMGKHAREENLVDIFEYGPDVVPATVAQQREFLGGMVKIGKKVVMREGDHPP
jgi:hypothetical protein